MRKEMKQCGRFIFSVIITTVMFLRCEFIADQGSVLEPSTGQKPARILGSVTHFPEGNSGVTVTAKVIPLKNCELNEYYGTEEFSAVTGPDGGYCILLTGLNEIYDDKTDCGLNDDSFIFNDFHYRNREGYVFSLEMKRGLFTKEIILYDGYYSKKYFFAPVLSEIRINPDYSFEIP